MYKLLLVLFLSIHTFGQGDLSKFFTSFETTTITRNNVNNIKTTGKLEFTVRQSEESETSYMVDLVKNRLNARYPDTYKEAGQRSESTRITILPNTRIEGFVHINNEVFFIEPANRYGAYPENLYVLYKETDRIKQIKYFEPNTYVELTSALEFLQQLEPLDRVLDIATDADFEFVKISGGVDAANARITSALNMAEGVYERDLGISFNIAHQNAWNEKDPYDGTGSFSILENFRAYWNTNKTHVIRDVAHLWTGKLTDQGLAYIGAACNNEYGYGLSAHASQSIIWVISAHEIGHNLGANHVENSGTCFSSIMIPIVSQASTFFCGTSVQEITNFVTTSGKCLEQKTNTLTIEGRVINPEGVPVRNASVVVYKDNEIIFATTTSTLGLFSVEGLQKGVVYKVAVLSKRYRFKHQEILLNENISIEFIGLE